MTPKHVSLAAVAAAATLVLATAARGADTPKKTPQLVEQGRAAFAKYCASCHGPKGEGDGPAAKALKPPPRNLVTEPPKGGASGVFQVLNTGVKGTAMIAFKHLPENDRWAIAHYVDGLKDAKK
jgi:mono/diheme cytochrome c family protein